MALACVTYLGVAEWPGSFMKAWVVSEGLGGLRKPGLPLKD